MADAEEWAKPVNRHREPPIAGPGGEARVVHFGARGRGHLGRLVRLAAAEARIRVQSEATRGCGGLTAWNDRSPGLHPAEAEEVATFSRPP